MSGVVRVRDGGVNLGCTAARRRGQLPLLPPRANADPCPVSVPDDDLRSTERSLLGTLAGVLSAVPDYLFAWLVEPDDQAVPLFESPRPALSLARHVPAATPD